MIESLEELEGLITLTEKERAWDESGPYTLPLLISPHIASLLSVPAIRRQFVPTADENSDDTGNLDPQEERAHQGTERLIHRYSSRAAFITTDSCFSYCRHCFRRRIAGKRIGPATEKEIAEAAEYAKEHPSITEILLTGGDLFTLSDSALDRMLSIFRERVPYVILRLCTRGPAVMPERFTPSLFSVIKKNQTGAPFYLMTQFNHPAELTEESLAAVRGFLDLGIPAMNQSVLLKGVNDDPEVLIELCNKLLLNRIKPYYLFQGDLVRGTKHLRVSIENGLRIDRTLRASLSGLATPQYTIDLPEGGGKAILTENPIISFNDGVYLIKTPDGELREYPDH